MERNEIVVTGANGWIGGHVVDELHRRGRAPIGISRDPAAARERRPWMRWLGLGPELDAAVADVGRVVNLAGRHPFEARWDDAFKAAMYESRVGLTERLVTALGRSTALDRVLVNASGYPAYGDTGDEPATEDVPLRTERFIARLDRDWELAAERAIAAGARVVLCRLGLVLGRDGGAFSALAAPFAHGAAPLLGSGGQWIPWVHIIDAVRALCFALDDPRCHGAMNVAAPGSATHATVAHAIATRAGNHVEGSLDPEAVREQLGEVSDLILMSVRMIPRRLLSLGFTFDVPSIDDALDRIMTSAAV